MKISLLEKYVDIKSQINALAEKEAALKEAIIEDMQKNSLDKVESDWGKFTVATRTTYSYSDKVKDMEEKVKLAKNKEMEKGIAEVKSETDYLVYTELK